MKNFTMIIAISTMAFAGCTCGQGWRPNIFSRLHDRIHGTSNVGAPCDVGCAPIAAAPLAYAPIDGCTDCGPTVSNSYGSYDSEYSGGYSSAIAIGQPQTYRGGPQGEPVQAAPRQ